MEVPQAVEEGNVGDNVRGILVGTNDEHLIGDVIAFLQERRVMWTNNMKSMVGLALSVVKGRKRDFETVVQSVREWGAEGDSEDVAAWILNKHVNVEDLARLKITFYQCCIVMSGKNERFRRLARAAPLQAFGEVIYPMMVAVSGVQYPELSLYPPGKVVGMFVDSLSPDDLLACVDSPSVLRGRAEEASLVLQKYFEERVYANPMDMSMLIPCAFLLGQVPRTVMGQFVELNRLDALKQAHTMACTWWADILNMPCELSTLHTPLFLALKLGGDEREAMVLWLVQHDSRFDLQSVRDMVPDRGCPLRSICEGLVSCRNIIVLLLCARRIGGLPKDVVVLICRALWGTRMDWKGWKSSWIVE